MLNMIYLARLNFEQSLGTDIRFSLTLVESPCKDTNIDFLRTRCRLHAKLAVSSSRNGESTQQYDFVSIVRFETWQSGEIGAVWCRIDRMDSKIE